MERDIEKLCNSSAMHKAHEIEGRSSVVKEVE